ncbi:MAG: esterase [Hydrocarboniphaga sp.]|uniref:alpha/beta hydrolase fold domain-containing protein n=1 Tax=Hydrocarboniphaga sp. TaxID=2033016 RepID=UPI00280EB389|nr:esterase [Hydrocarboniphaga sp.]
MNDISNRMLAIDAQCVIISVDYRLAPETPHPGSLEDYYAALKWVHDNAEALGVDRRRIAVSGESAWKRASNMRGG